MKLEFPQKYFFDKKYYNRVLISLIIIGISIVFLLIRFKYPEHFITLFKFWEVAIVFFLGIMFGIFGVIFYRHQTGYILYNSDSFQIKNRLFLGPSFKSNWHSLKELKIQILHKHEINLMLNFEGKQLIALNDGSQKYKSFALNMINYLISVGIKYKIKAEILSSSNDISEINLDEVLKWLDED